jgi:hypothetical protein
MVVCAGSCHREADADRTEQEEDAEIARRYGWQGALGKQCQMPNERELKKLADHQPEFIAWLWRQNILKKDWDWNLYPPWYLWNLFESDFLGDALNFDPQLTFDL